MVHCPAGETKSLLTEQKAAVFFQDYLVRGLIPESFTKMNPPKSSLAKESQLTDTSPNSTEGSTQIETLRPHLGDTIQLHHLRRATEMGTGNDFRVFK